jgi:uncharacterized membrane protein YoaK (UPF0700 family)
MDQTSFSLLVGFLVGSHAGAFGLRYFTGWTLWITYPTGGLIGLILVAALIYVSIEFIGRSREKKCKR